VPRSARCSHDRGAAAVSVQFAAIVERSCRHDRVFPPRGGGTPRLLLTGLCSPGCGAVISVLLALATRRVCAGCVLARGDLEWAFSPWTSALAACRDSRGTRDRTPLNVLAAGELRARSVGLELESASLLFLRVPTLTGSPS